MYICNNCGYSSEKFFGLCPKCKNSIGEYIEESNSINSSNFNDITIKGKSKSSFNYKIYNVDRGVERAKAKFKTQFPTFNNLISSVDGFVPGQVVLFGAMPGTGKSTICAAISNSNTLYISSEENYNQVNDRFVRLGVFTPELMTSTDIEEVLDAIENTTKDIIIIDSINSIGNGSYQSVSNNTNLITKLVKSTEKIAIIISQVSRSGEIIGMQSTQHIVDTILYMEKDNNSNNIVMYSTKNRFGAIGDIAIFRHQDDGVVEVNLNEKRENHEIGVTYTELVFGSKKLNVGVEALVAESVGLKPTLISSGYNQLRFMQIIGLISYYCHIDLSNKDIYLYVRDGIKIDNVYSDLAIVNSILSSYYGKNIFHRIVNGEISLSGTCINGVADNIKIKTVYDIDKLYRTHQDKKGKI